MKFNLGGEFSNSRTGFAEIEPYAGIALRYELGFCILFACVKLRLDGDFMECHFPTKAEVNFAKYPLYVGYVCI